MATLKGITSNKMHDLLIPWFSARGFTSGTLYDRWNGYWKSLQDGKSLADSILGHLHSEGAVGQSLPEVLSDFYQKKGVAGNSWSERERNFFRNTSNTYTL